MPAQCFIIERPSFDPATGIARFPYGLDGKHFIEVLELPKGGDAAQAATPAFQKLLNLTATVLGVSYFKLTAPLVIAGPDIALTKEEFDFVLDIYENGLGEFYARNDLKRFGHLDLQFPLDKGPAPRAPALPDRALLPIGGGKDSLVSVALLEDAGVDFTPFAVNPKGPIVTSVDAGILEQGDYMTGETVDESAFPFVRRVGDLAVISCSSAVPTAPFVAAGRFDEKQAERLAKCLGLLGNAGYFRVVMIHHPPNIESQHPGFGLWGSKLFRKVIREHGAEIILHGHTHRSSMHSIDGPDAEVPVIGVAAAGATPGSLSDPARYNFFRIERIGNGWSCTMREYGYQRLGTEIVMRLQMRIY